MVKTLVCDYKLAVAACVAAAFNDGWAKTNDFVYSRTQQTVSLEEDFFNDYKFTPNQALPRTIVDKNCNVTGYYGFSAGFRFKWTVTEYHGVVVIDFQLNLENSERLLFAKIIVNSNVFVYDKYQFLDGVTNEDINEFISYLKKINSNLENLGLQFLETSFCVMLSKLNKHRLSASIQDINKVLESGETITDEFILSLKWNLEQAK
ncbi:MAG: hypothetical protein AB1695_14340 [Stygiobacter sp.]